MSSARLNFGGLTLSTARLSTVRSAVSLSQRTWSVDPLSSVTHPLTKASLSSLSQTHRFPENSAKSRAESVDRESREAELCWVLMNLGVNVPVEGLRESLREFCSDTCPGILSLSFGIFPFLYVVYWISSQQAILADG